MIAVITNCFNLWWSALKQFSTMLCPRCIIGVLLLLSTQLLTNNLLQPCTSHRPARPVLWCQEKWFHGEWWLSWWSHWREPGRRPGPGSPVWAWAWGRSIWPSCRCPSCSHRCTGTNWRRAKTGLKRRTKNFSDRKLLQLKREIQINN